MGITHFIALRYDRYSQVITSQKQFEKSTDQFKLTFEKLLRYNNQPVENSK